MRIWDLVRVFNNSKLKCAHKLTKRRTKMRTSKFFQKAHIFWSKCAQVPTYFGQNVHKNAHIKNFQKSAQMRTYFGQKAHKNAHTRHKNVFFKVHTK